MLAEKRDATKSPCPAGLHQYPTRRLDDRHRYVQKDYFSYSANMDTSTRTSEGIPSNCPVCGKHMIITACTPIGDATCPHCGTLLYPQLKRGQIEGDDERRLADIGIIVETNDEGEITAAELHGPRFNDRTIEKLARCKDIPVIRICNTALTLQGIEKLRQLLPQTVIEEP